MTVLGQRLREYRRAGNASAWPALAIPIVIALSLRGGLAFRSLSSDPSRCITPDSEAYVDLAHDLGAAVFADNPNLLAETFSRPPGYPTWCRVSFALFGDSAASIVLTQVVAGTAVVIAVYIAVREVGPVGAACAAAILLAIEPISIMFCSYVMTETVFAAFLFAAWMAWWHSIDAETIPMAFLAGILFGLTVLIRPITTYLPILLLPIDFFLRPGRATLKSAASAMLAAGFILPVGLLVARNTAITGVPFVSTIEGANLLYYRAAGVLAAEQARSRRQVEMELRKDFKSNHPELTNPGFVSRQQRYEAIPILASRPGRVITMTITGAARLLFGPGYKSLSRLLHGKPSYSAPPATGTLVQLLQAGLLIVLYLLACTGAWVAFRERQIKWLLTSVCICFYLVVVSSGPEAYSRFRVPLMPFVCCLAGPGIGEFASRFKRRRPATQSRSAICSDTGPEAAGRIHVPVDRKNPYTRGHRYQGNSNER